MKNKIKTTFILALLSSISMTSYAVNDTQYIMNIGVKTPPKIIDKIENGDATTPTPTPKTCGYITEFDTEASGAGSYSDGNRTVRLGANQTSKPTNKVFGTDDLVEARVVFTTAAANYANQIRFIDDKNKIIMLWYNYDKTLYLYNNGSEIGRYSVGGGGSSVMEMRYNMKTGEYSLIINGQVSKSGINYVGAEYIYSNVFEGSGSQSSLTLHTLDSSEECMWYSLSHK